MNDDSPTGSPPDEVRSTNELQTMDPVELLLVMSDGKNRELLEQVLTEAHAVTTTTAVSEVNYDFDVCIVDEHLFRQQKQAIQTYKQRTEPEFFPVLLTVPENSELRSDSDVWTVVDDIVTIPVSKDELRARLSALLRQRAQSITLIERESTLQDALSELTLKDEAIASSTIGITITDHTKDDNPIQYVNEAFQALTGYDEADITGHNCRFLQGPKTQEEPVAELRAAIENGRSTTVTFRNYRKDGSEFWNRLTVAPIRAEDGTITNFVGFQEDVTEQEGRKQDIQLNERRFEAVFEDPNILVGLLEPDGTVIDVNGTAMAYVDVDLSDITGAPFWKTPWFAGDDALQSEVKQLAERAASGEYVEFELDLSEAVGEPLVVSGMFRPVTNDDGEVVSLIISGRDITERKQQKNRLAESVARYESLTEDVLDTSDVGTFILDANFDVVWINVAVEEYFGIDRETVVGENKPGLIESQIKHVFENPDRVQNTLLESYEHNDGIEQFEAHVIGGEDTEERWVRHWSQPIESGLYEGGRIEHYSDVTERKRRDNQLASFDRLLRHNMKNTMNVIHGRAEIIAETTSSKLQDNAEAILSSGSVLLDMTEKQREIVELLTENPDPRPVDISTIVRESVQEVRTAYPDADVTVDVPDSIQASAVLKLDCAITELLENGIIHTNQSDPSVHVSITHSDSGVCVRIKDSGPGLPEKEQLILQGEGEQGSLDHGRGMGIPLANHVIAYCDGHIKCCNSDANGTCVKLWLQHSSKK